MLIRLAEFTYLQKDSPFELAMQGAPFLQGFGEHDINPCAEWHRNKRNNPRPIHILLCGGLTALTEINEFSRNNQVLFFFKRNIF